MRGWLLVEAFTQTPRKNKEDAVVIDDGRTSMRMYCALGGWSG